MTATAEQLVARYQQDRDELALLELYAINAGAIHKIARKFARQPADLDDALQEARLTLLLCARNFDASKGFRFITFLWTAVYRNLSKWSLENRLIRVPQSAVERGVKLPQLAQPTDSYGPTPALALTIDYRQPLHEAREDLERHDSQQRYVDWLLRSQLDKRSQKVVRLRLAGKTGSQIGKALGVSKGRVDQLERKAMKRLGLDRNVTAVLRDGK